MAAPRFERGRFAVDGQFWGLSNRASVGLLAIPFAGAAVVALAWSRPGVYYGLVREDSVLEWLQFASYVAVAVLAAWTAVRLRRESPWLAAAFGLFALFGLLAAGEEVSWGQRLFGLGTPQELAEVNNQEELNVHDVAEVQGKLNLGLALASLYGLLAPLLVRRRVLVVPPLALASAFFAMLAYTCARAAFFPHPSHALAKFSEWPETCFAAALGLFALLAWRKADPEK
jgi:hypothetical protein